MHSRIPITFPSTGGDKAVLKSTVAAGLLILLVIRRLHLPPHDRGFAGVVIFSLYWDRHMSDFRCY